ncbi:hypothetical protein Droror1_Dr00016246 [Drosera rotundifolia]
MIGAWNVRGINKAAKQVALKNFLIANKLSLLTVLESKVKANKFKQVSSACFKHWGVLNNYYYTNNGRIWCCWDGRVWEISIWLVLIKPCMLKLSLRMVRTRCLSLFFMLGTLHLRMKLWEELIAWSSTISLPRLVMSGFNMYLKHDEKVGHEGVSIDLVLISCAVV